MVQKISLKDFNKKEENSNPFVSFHKGSRKNIHPSFEAIDDFDCYFIYNKKKKYFYVEYSPIINNNIKKYTRTIISNNVSNVINDIKKYQENPLL